MIKSACEEYGPLISAMIDDELSSDEVATVKAHLESCGACRQRADIFGQLTGLAPSSVPHVPRDWRQRIDRRARRRRRKYRFSWALSYAAAAAVLVAMVGVLQHFRSPAEPPATIDTNVTNIANDDAANDHADIIGSLETLQIVSRQAQRTDDAMRRMMELDLRALKVQIKRLNLEPERIERLCRRIDKLIQRVTETDSDTHDNSLGASI